ncbi:MAG: histidine phosphatase family protein [Planctomycetaceae bacterium]|nr:histidine phosphatase family protein [Planctomycetales bacterium]MCB9925974.1 histidine phosphatase family protein [Planctomycetaceae bacterium]
MLKIFLIRPGVTDFDEQGRIKGTLDIPLNENGTVQVAQTIDDLATEEIDAIYFSPCQCCEQTTQLLTKTRDLKAKSLKGLTNLNHGLWHGKRIEEVKQQQPKVYRQWQEHPETVCPPEGERLSEVTSRVQTTLAKLMKKHKDGVIAIVVPEPLTSVILSLLKESSLGDLWQAECRGGGWEAFHVTPNGVVSNTPNPVTTLAGSQVSSDQID